MNSLTRRDPLCGLLRSAAIAGLAESIYNARAIMYTLDVPCWLDIAPEDKRIYTASAQALMDSLAPIPKLDERGSGRMLAFGASRRDSVED